MSDEASFDVVGIGNAIVDVIARAGDDFLVREGLAKGSMRLIDERSSTGGSAPVPKAAERFRSSTLVLLPSQWSFMPMRCRCSQTDG